MSQKSGIIYLVRFLTRNLTEQLYKIRLLVFVPGSLFNSRICLLIDVRYHLDIWEPMPLVIFGSATLLIGVSTLFLRGTESELAETTADTKVCIASMLLNICQRLIHCNIVSKNCQL